MASSPDVHDGSSAHHPQHDDQSLGELFGELGRDFTTLMRQEVELAKAELRDEAGKAGKAGGLLGAAAAAAVLALTLLSFAAAWGLDELMPTGVAFLIVGLVFAAIALVLYVAGRTRLRQVHPVPDDTVDTLKEDVQWAKNQLT